MKLGKRVAGRFKAMGYWAGTPDIMIFEPRWEFHGMFLELKMPGGKYLLNSHALTWTLYNVNTTS